MGEMSPNHVAQCERYCCCGEDEMPKFLRKILDYLTEKEERLIVNL